MKWKGFFWLALSAAVMLMIPWLTVMWIQKEAGMAICVMLFFVVNPIYSALLGLFAGQDWKSLWSLPISSAGLCILDGYALIGAKQHFLSMRRHLPNDRNTVYVRFYSHEKEDKAVKPNMVASEKMRSAL